MKVKEISVTFGRTATRNYQSVKLETTATVTLDTEVPEDADEVRKTIYDELETYVNKQVAELARTTLPK